MVPPEGISSFELDWKRLEYASTIVSHIIIINGKIQQRVYQPSRQVSNSSFPKDPYTSALDTCPQEAAMKEKTDDIRIPRQRGPLEVRSSQQGRT